MKLSFAILQDYITFTEPNVQVVADMLTERVAEVDEVEVQGARLANCIVGQVQDLQKHPDADRLNMCQVHTGSASYPIVCGGSNLRNGMRVAFAPVGTVIHTPSGETFTINKAKIRGEVSEGMICAAEELGLEDLYPNLPEQGARPVLDLGDGDEHLGEPLAEFLELTDTIIHIDNHAITHRPDLFSTIGFARELVAMGMAKWKHEPVFAEPAFTSDALPFALQVADAQSMPRYLSCCIHIDAIGTTPDWMQRRLAATGWRSVNVPVDITNYVLVETGLPLHCFDADDIQGNVTMRAATAGETITTLDGKERKLSEGALVLADDAGIFDLLGIMGGMRSSTKEGTTKLYVHGASLDPIAIRKAMIAMGHRTDAGTVYEKGVLPYTVEQGFYRTIELILQLVPGAHIASMVESVGSTQALPPVITTVAFICKRLGIAVEQAQIVQILTDLGCTVTVQGQELQITPPLWRRDLRLPEDITEEIGRMYGYNSIQAVLPVASITPPKRDHRINRFRASLAQQCYTELLPLSLVGPDLLTKAGLNVAHALEILDPIGTELSRMQMSVLPRLLEQVGQMVAAKPVAITAFTISHVFASNVPEYNQAGIICAQPTVRSIAQEPFYMVRTAVENAFATIGHTVRIEPNTSVPNYGHPGRICDVFIDSVYIGHICQIHPMVAKQFGLGMPVAVALLNMDAVQTCTPVIPFMQALPAFPAIEYDETITITTATSVASILQKMAEVEPLLESMTIKDVYAAALPAQSYAVTFRFVYRSTSGTLTEAQVKPVHANVLAQLTTHIV